MPSKVLIKPSKRLTPYPEINSVRRIHDSDNTQFTDLRRDLNQNPEHKPLQNHSAHLTNQHFITVTLLLAPEPSPRMRKSKLTFQGEVLEFETKKESVGQKRPAVIAKEANPAPRITRNPQPMA